LTLSSLLNTVKRAYQYFQRDDEVDELERQAFIKRMETIKPSTPSETAAIKLGQKLTISDSLLITPQGSTLATSNV